MGRDTSPYYKLSDGNTLFPNKCWVLSRKIDPVEYYFFTVHIGTHFFT